MSKTIAFLIFAIISVHFSHAAQATDGSGQELLAVAKVTGACGILDSMIEFQKTTKMPGGNEFVSRFWSVEAARMGITVAQLSERCNKAVAMYDQLWQALEAK